MLYHASNNPNLTIELSETGTATNCSGLFFARNYTTVKFYGEFVYKCEEPEDFFDDCDADEDMLAELLAEKGIDYEAHEELCWNAIIKENLSWNEEEEWESLVKKITNNSGWYAQELRIELARRQGFTAVGMNDECGSICILREFVQLELCSGPEDEDYL